MIFIIVTNILDGDFQKILQDGEIPYSSHQVPEFLGFHRSSWKPTSESSHFPLRFSLTKALEASGRWSWGMTPTTTTNAPSTAPEKALCTNLGFFGGMLGGGNHGYGGLVLVDLTRIRLMDEFYLRWWFLGQKQWFWWTQRSQELGPVRFLKLRLPERLGFQDA